MPEFSTYISAVKGQSPAVLSLVMTVLREQGITCTTQQDLHCKTAFIVLEESAVTAEIAELIGGLRSKDHKIIILNLADSIADIIKWKLMAAGANDVIDWAGDRDAAIRIIHARLSRWQMIENLLESPPVKDKMIGDSITWKKFLRKITEAACFTSSNILLLGESGTGKELTAGMIHSIDQRKTKGDLVLVDCTTIVPELFGSEFYGHEKGSFTSGVYSREGAFALANNGSLFLDELGELPLTLQAGLLRVIQEKTYKKVGSNNWHKTQFRLICATNRDLKAEIGRGLFREDLYYRIATAVFTIPSLNERKEDIPELVRYFLREELKTIVAPAIDTSVMNYLLARNYPGNVRELKQLVSRIAMRYTGQDVITIGDIPEDELMLAEEVKDMPSTGSLSMQQSIRLAIASGKDLSKIKTEIASLAMETALEDCNGNLKLAAKKLNVDVRTLQYIRSKK